MTPRIAGGWQTTLADLALILFIVSVAGLQAGDDEHAEPVVPAQGQPLGIYIPSEGTASLREWLAEQAPDPRQRLTVVARYRVGEAEAAARRALDLASQAAAAGHGARIVLEQSESTGLVASLAYDRAPEQMAQSLQVRAQD